MERVWLSRTLQVAPMDKLRNAAPRSPPPALGPARLAADFAQKTFLIPASPVSPPLPATCCDRAVSAASTPPPHTHLARRNSRVRHSPSHLRAGRVRTGTGVSNLPWRPETQAWHGTGHGTGRCVRAGPCAAWRCCVWPAWVSTPPGVPGAALGASCSGRERTHAAAAFTQRAAAAITRVSKPCLLNADRPRRGAGAGMGGRPLPVLRPAPLRSKEGGHRAASGQSLPEEGRIPERWRRASSSQWSLRQGAGASRVGAPSRGVWGPKVEEGYSRSCWVGREPSAIAQLPLHHRLACCLPLACTWG